MDTNIAINISKYVTGVVTSHVTKCSGIHSKVLGFFCFKRAEIYKSQSFVRLRLEATSATASRDGVYDIAISLDNKLYNHSLSSLHTHH